MCVCRRCYHHAILYAGNQHVLHKAKSTRCFLELIQSHDHSLDIATHGEELVDLILTRVEGHVADVESGGDRELGLIVVRGELVSTCCQVSEYVCECVNECVEAE